MLLPMTTVLIPFIDILYSLAIGTGFVYFPENPLENIAGTFTFILTLFIAAHDWYEYHDKADVVPQDKAGFYHLWQVFVILVLNQMFRHSVTPSLVSWLIYFGVFATLNAVWNAFTRFVDHWLFVATTSLLAIGNFAAGIFYSRITALVPTTDGRWIVLLYELFLISAILSSIRLLGRAGFKMKWPKNIR